MNRRNVLAGLGGLAVGGGALLGSGAFSSVEASRDVEVNVLVENEIGDDDQIADVLVNVGGFDTVAVDPGGGENTNGSNLFPTGTTTGSSNYTVGNGPTTDYLQDWVSLIENDVELVFGPTTNSEELPPNSTASFDNLFALVNTNGSQTNGSHTLSFGNGGFTEPNTDVSFQSSPDPPGLPSGVQVDGDTGVEYGVDVTTDDSDDTATGDLVIEIS
jgi:hypothetical protein